MSKRDLSRETNMLFVKDINNNALGLRVGQSFRVLSNDEDGRCKNAVIKKLFQYHALCRVNGRFNECYTYNELACIIRRREKNHERRRLTHE